MNQTTAFEKKITSYKEIHINIEDVHAILLAKKTTEQLVKAGEKKFQPMHFHSYYEIFYVTDGILEVEFEQKSAYLKKDNMIIISPKTAHCSIAGSKDVSRYCINFFIEKNSLKTEPSLFDSLINICSDEYIYIDNGFPVLESIQKISENIACCNQLKISMYFYQFVLDLMEVTGNFSSVSHKEFLLDSSVNRTDKIQRIISLYYMENISLEFLAKSLHLSTRQVNRIVQNFYGCTYREIIARTRLKAATELLKNTNITISEISSRIGYQSLRGFYSAFKKHYGCLPTEYRRREKTSSLMA